MTNKIKLDKEVIRELATLLQENSLTEIEWTQGNQTIRLARQTDTRSISRDFSLKPDATPATTSTKNLPDPVQHPGAVLSPMVGAAYISPEPGAKPFVELGSKVSEGDTLLIIEAMKTMNPIPAPKSGTIKEIIVGNGMPVEYGELLMIIE